MKVFRKLETGLWTYTDKKGHVFVLTEKEFIELNRVGYWWENIKNKYFKL